MKQENVEFIQHAAAGREDLDGKVILALIAERDRLLAMLRDMEKLCTAQPCPVCGAGDDARHRPDCRLIAVLGRT